MSTETETAPPAKEQGRLARNWKYVLAAVALIGWGIAAWEAKKNGEPIPAPPVVDVSALLPMTADRVGPIDYEGLPYHGDHHDEHGPEHLQVQAARWPDDRITYSIDYASARGLNPPLSDEAVRNEARIGTGWWSEHLAIEFVEVPYPGGMIPNRFRAIDGPGRTLAQAFLADGTRNAKPLELDSSERWVAGPPAANQVSLRTVWCHEIGHSLGLSHDAANAVAVMRPSYTAGIPREQERDIARAVAIGYKRRDKVPPAPTDLITFPISAKTDDVADALRKAGFTVVKP